MYVKGYGGVYAVQTMYTIKQAAARAGLTVPVLRAWERRYGIVTPARTANGYRQYDDIAIARVRAMRRLVDSGMSPSAAAASIASGAIPHVESARDGSLQRGALDFSSRFVTAAAGFDLVAIEEVLDEMFAAGTFERIADEHLLPALKALGDAWADGRLDIASEHAASHAVLRRLSAAYQAAGRPSDELGAILVGLPPGARHELGGLAFAVAARRAGLPVLYLGPDLPVHDWVSVAARTHARAAVIGVVTMADREPAEQVAMALLEAHPDLMVAYGGRNAPNSSVDPAELGPIHGPIRLPEGLQESIEALASAVRGGPGR
jgi:MerR family transcriptional regulator, light-induced transcriptional regulator